MQRLIVSSLMLVALSACTSEEAPSTPPKGQDGALVSVETIEESRLAETRQFLGEVRNAGSTMLAAGGSGKVVRVGVLEGDEVERGQVLVRLDDAILRKQLQEARANLERTKVDFGQATRDAARFGALSEKGYFPGQEAEEIVTRKAALEVAIRGQEASVGRLEEEIAQMRVVAPVDGTVARRHVSKGQWLKTGEPAIELASEGSLEVHVRVPSNVLETIQQASGVRILHPGDEVHGKIAGVVGSLDPRTRTGLMRVVPDESRPWLRQGAALPTEFKIVREVDGAVVPNDALVHGVTGTRVFRVKDQKAEPHEVYVVARSGDRVLVESATLSVGDRVVTRGNERLRPGQALQIQDQEPVRGESL